MKICSILCSEHLALEADNQNTTTTTTVPSKRINLGRKGVRLFDERDQERDE